MICLPSVVGAPGATGVLLEKSCLHRIYNFLPILWPQKVGRREDCRGEAVSLLLRTLPLKQWVKLGLHVHQEGGYGFVAPD